MIEIDAQLMNLSDKQANKQTKESDYILIFVLINQEDRNDL